MKNVSKIDISDFMKVRIADGDNTYVIGKTLVGRKSDLSDYRAWGSICSISNGAQNL